MDFKMRTNAKTVLLCIALSGCGVTASPQPVQPGPPIEVQPDSPTPIRSFDLAACAEALARQAEVHNASAAYRDRTSEVIEGTLNEGLECGIPEDFADRVRKACPMRPYRHLTDDEIKAIREVR
jgi:hypothetical protein